MIAEIRRLEPKPGRAFGAPPEQLATADVFVSLAPDNSWRIELNSEALPRVLVNETYAASIKRGRASEADRLFLATNLQNANWLTKSLEQRARTILKVATEIVRRQDGFFIAGRRRLAPAQSQDRRRCDRHARIDGLARHFEQIYPHAARPVRDEIFLLDVDRLERRRRSPFGRIGALQDQADDRRRGPAATCFRTT